MPNFNLKTWKDVLPGSIVKSKKNNTYVLLSDAEGNRALYTKTGTFFRVNDDLTFGKNHEAIQSISAFDTLPVMDAISEGIKLMYTGRPASAPLKVIYTAEPAEVTAARKALADAQAAADRARAVMAGYGF